MHPSPTRHEEQHRRGWTGRSSRRHTSSSCVGCGPYRTEVRCTLRRCSRIFHSGAERSGCGHSMSRSLAETMPRRAASLTALARSRSSRLSSASGGLSSARAVAPRMSGAWREPQIAAAVNAPSGLRLFPITGSEAEATLNASRWSEALAFSKHCRRVPRVAAGHRASRRSVIARAYPATAHQATI